MNKTIYIFVNGILTFPGSTDNWNGKAVTWTHVNTPYRAEKIEYIVGPISRVLGQKKRAKKLIKTLEFYRGWRIILVGHSNGCDVILDALRAIPPIGIAELHLLSAACTADFNKNGLNHLPVGYITVYIAAKDFALKLAKSWFGKLLGYGALGKVGPKNCGRQCAVQTAHTFGHSDWFKGLNFNTTMLDITNV